MQHKFFFFPFFFLVPNNFFLCKKKIFFFLYLIIKLNKKLWKILAKNYFKLFKLEDKDVHHLLGLLSASDELILPVLSEYVQRHLALHKASWIKEHPLETLNAAFQHESWKELQNCCVSTICANPWMLFETPHFY